MGPEKEGGTNEGWLRQWWRQLKELKKPMMIGTGFGWLIGATHGYLATLSYQAGLTSQAWAWAIGAIGPGIVMPIIMFEIMRRGE